MTADRETPLQEKCAARERALAARDALSPAERAASSLRVAERLLGLPQVRGARAVLGFSSFGTEIDTRPVLERLLAAHVLVALPRIVGKRAMVAQLVSDLERDLEPGRWGIPQPREGLEQVPPERFDCVLVPGSAFDEQARRCGYGGGFYDSYLPRTRTGCFWVAPAFEAQVVDEIPQEPHDLRVHALVTERRVITRP
jgi:5-formyltetrahydrofolate cyclo-ligase